MISHPKKSKDDYTSIQITKPFKEQLDELKKNEGGTFEDILKRRVKK